jgi:hypothetical protein
MSLSKIACAALVSGALVAPAWAAGDTESQQTPAAPGNAGADNQPNKPPTAVESPSAKDIKNGSREQEKRGASQAPGTNNSGGAQP